MLRIRSQREPRRQTLSVFGWPNAMRLPSLAIAALLTIHTAALVVELNTYFDALLTIASLVFLLFAAHAGGRTGEGTQQPVTWWAVATILCVAGVTLLNASLAGTAKLAVLVAFYLIVPLAIATYRAQSILAGFVAYALIEISLVLGFSEQFNPNTAAHRLIIATCVCGLCLRPRWLRYFGLLLGAGLAFAFESRAALAAATIAFAYVQLANTGLLSVLRKQPVAFLFLLGVIGFFIRSTAMEFLVNESPNAVQEFFADKRNKDLNEDPFDRQQAWNSGWKAVAARPLTGWGLGNETVGTGDQRAHSAYLKLAVECGIPTAVVIVTFFLVMMHRSFACLLPRGQTPLAEIACFVLFYLLVAAFFESSGLLSIGTPSNLIAYCGFSWLHTHRGSHNSRRRRSTPGKEARASREF